MAVDWGHQPLPYPTQEEYELNPKCEVGNCHRPLCAEQFISGVGFTKLFNLKYGTNFRTREIVALEANGDERAKKEFDLYRKVGLKYGFLEVVSSPMARSSYRAERALDFNNAGIKI